MVVGLPGTGIGGLFYLCLALWMPIHEAYLLARGRSSLERWRFIGLNWLIVAGMLACLWVFMLAMKWALLATGLDRPRGVLEHAGLAGGIAHETNTFFASAGWASAMSLIALVVVVQILRLTVGRRARADQTVVPLR